MTEFVFGPYRLEVDVEATRNWYDLYGEPAGGCDCAYCRNFTAAVETLRRRWGNFWLDWDWTSGDRETPPSAARWKADGCTPPSGI